MCKEVYGYVYMVKNLVNGKIYFGITVNDFQRRYDGNIAKYTHNDHLRNSINTYGIENFEINEQFDVAYNEDDLYDLEDMYICLYNTLDEHYGYNKKRSGSKHKGSGRPNEETKRKMSEAHKGNTNMLGHTHTEEAKRKMSETHKGEKNPMYGKPLSEEHKQKLNKNVICLETLQVFDNATKAGEWCGVGRTSISNCLNGGSKSAGKHPVTGEKLHWMHYEDYLKLQEEKQQNKTQDLVTEVA